MKGKIFNAQEVQAIIAGTKTMFREVIKIQPANENQVFSTVASSIRNKDIGTHNFINPKATWEQTKKFKCPYQVGKKIFCKEAWGRKATGSGIAYKADNPNQLIYQHLPVKWRLPQHMKQEHSRLTLEITDIKVERLQDISEDDCLDEGCYFAEVFLGDFSKPPRKIFNFSKKNLLKEDGLLDYKLAFKKYWDANHEKPEEKFETNPFVWVVDFKIIN